MRESVSKNTQKPYLEWITTSRVALLFRNMLNIVNPKREPEVTASKIIELVSDERSINKVLFQKLSTMIPFSSAVKNGVLTHNVTTVSEALSQNIKYTITGTYSKDPSELNDLFFSLDYSDENGKDIEVADLHFSLGLLRLSEKKYWRLVHRLVRSQGLGISGTDFYIKAEDCIRTLIDDGHLKERTVVVPVSQPSVINWLLKNGYTFDDQGSSESGLVNYFNLVEGELIPKEGFFLVKDKSKSADYFRDDFIVYSNFVKDKNFKKWSKNIEVGEDGWFYFSDKEVVYELMAHGYIPRLFMTKEL